MDDTSSLEAEALRSILGGGSLDGRIQSVKGTWYYPLPDLPLDADVRKVGELWATCIERFEGRMVDTDAMTREIEERYAQDGFVVEVAWKEQSYLGDGTPYFSPTIEWLGYTDRPPEYDHDRQAFDVQRDIIGTGDRGQITGSGLIREV